MWPPRPVNLEPRQQDATRRDTGPGSPRYPGDATPPTYAELHLHTAFSFLDGASHPEEIVARAAELGYEYLAITDHDGLHGALEFSRACVERGIQPIVGAELTLTDGSHLTLLVESRTGYANLCRLITAAHYQSATLPTITNPPTPIDAPRPANLTLEERRPTLDPALLRDHADGLILLTGCREGMLSRLVDAGRYGEARDLLHRYVDWFGPDSVVVELQHNLTHGDTRRVRELVRLATMAGLPYVATGNVHYHRQDRHRLQDVLVAIRNRGSLDATHRERRANSHFYLRDAEEMAERFALYPEAIAQSITLARRCAAFDLTRNLDYEFPDYPTEDGQSPDSYLATMCHGMFEERYPLGHPSRDKAREKLDTELALIKHHGLAGFFLLHHDLLELARQVAAELRHANGNPSAISLPPGRGRGSSVSSIVCYLIGLSPVDPVQHNLSLGRFLNEELRSVPDIDLDFPREIREKLIARIYEVYPDRAGLICTFSTYRLRSAVRDVGKALGLPIADLDRISRLSEPTSARHLAEQLAHIPEYAARIETTPWSLLVELTGQLAGMPRHVGQHSGGMVISSQPLVGLAPMQPSSMADRHLIQWDKDSCDDARFVKIDFLALGMMSLVEECLDLVHVAWPDAPMVDLSRISYEDPDVFAMIQRGDTIGTFQIESRAQIQTLLKVRPETLADLVVQVAIIRPGPIIGGAVSPYMQRRTNPDFQPTYDHPSMKESLEDTLGVILYQDQVIEVAMAVAGFTAGQADGLRRSITRKRSKEAMAAWWEQFRDGAAKNELEPVDEPTAREIFRKLLGFAEYGFPRAHAVSFAVLAYQSCWLKYHFPAPFTCALFNNQPMGFYPPHVIVNDAKRAGVRVWPPDINVSEVRCTVERRTTVRIGLQYISRLGEETAERIVADRRAHGPFRSLADLIRRVPMKREAAEALAAVGAFDVFGLSRREAMWQIGLFIAPVAHTDRSEGTTNVKGRRAGKHRRIVTQQALALPVAQDMVELPTMPAWDRMAADYGGTGVSPNWHPLGLLRTQLPAGVVSTTDLFHLPHGITLTIAGMVVCRQRPGTAKGITFLLMEDEVGLANIIVRPHLYESHRLLVRGEPFLMITGLLQKQNGTINIVAEEIRPLTQARQRLPQVETTPAPAEPAEMRTLRPVLIVASHNGYDEPGEVIDVEARLSRIRPESHNYR
ncbi:MAG TPA: error-prone DNA polymerase [Thermomicrobiales bacterium]|jgi:error-prone DNA polymerase|nr:error-prone DNA polymerase [Thermomicrobiales bacterium]